MIEVDTGNGGGDDDEDARERLILNSRVGGAGHSAV